MKNFENDRIVNVPFVPNPNSAGIGNPLDSEVEPMQLPESFVAGIKNPYCAYVSGDSMEPYFFHDDILILDYLKDKTPRKDGVPLSCVLNGERFLKIFIFNNKGIVLRSLNPKYEDIILKEDDEFYIEGEVKKYTREVNLKDLKEYWMR